MTLIGLGFALIFRKREIFVLLVRHKNNINLLFVRALFAMLRDRLVTTASLCLLIVSTFAFEIQLDEDLSLNTVLSFEDSDIKL